MAVDFQEDALYRQVAAAAEVCEGTTGEVVGDNVVKRRCNGSGETISTATWYRTDDHILIIISLTLGITVSKQIPPGLSDEQLRENFTELFTAARERHALGRL